MEFGDAVAEGQNKNGRENYQKSTTLQLVVAAIYSGTTATLGGGSLVVSSPCKRSSNSSRRCFEVVKARQPSGAL